MNKHIIAVTGIFSTLEIHLGQDVMNKLAYMEPKDNPLAAVKDDLEAVLDKFEQLYFEATHKEKGPDAPAKHTNVTEE